MTQGQRLFLSLHADFLGIQPAKGAHGFAVVVFPGVDAPVQLFIQGGYALFSCCVQADDGGDQIGQLEADVVCLGDGEQGDFQKGVPHAVSAFAAHKVVCHGSGVPFVGSVVTVVEDDDGFFVRELPFHVHVNAFLILKEAHYYSGKC